MILCGAESVLCLCFWSQIYDWKEDKLLCYFKYIFSPSYSSINYFHNMIEFFLCKYIPTVTVKRDCFLYKIGDKRRSSADFGCDVTHNNISRIDRYSWTLDTLLLLSLAVMMDIERAIWRCWINLCVAHFLLFFSVYIEMDNQRWCMWFLYRVN